MKKQLLTVTAAALLFIAAGNAQAQADRKGFVGIGIGASIPTGDFGDNSSENDKSGFAKTGVLFDFQIGHKFTDVVGAMLLVRSQAHKLDEEAFANRSGHNLTVPVPVEADPWATLGVMAGPFVSFPLSETNTIAFESRALAGYSRSRRPEISVGSGASKYTIESEEASSFAWMIGTGLRFNVTDRFGLGVHVDYYSANPEFDAEDEPAYKQPVNLVNATLSLGYRFN